MKHISAYFDQVETAHEKFAWWPVRSSFSKKLIWFKKYVLLEITYDDMGRPPIKGRSWNLIYTQHEYLLYLLKKGKNGENY
jgi:hypothetical protein